MSGQVPFLLAERAMKLPAASCGELVKFSEATPPFTKAWRVLLAFILVSSYGVFGEGE